MAFSFQRTNECYVQQDFGKHDAFVYWILCTYTQNRCSGEIMQSKITKPHVYKSYTSQHSGFQQGLVSPVQNVTERDRVSCGVAAFMQHSWISALISSPLSPQNTQGWLYAELAWARWDLLNQVFLRHKCSAMVSSSYEKQPNHIHRLILSQLADSS